MQRTPHTPTGQEPSMTFIDQLTSLLPTSLGNVEALTAHDGFLPLYTGVVVKSTDAEAGTVTIVRLADQSEIELDWDGTRYRFNLLGFAERVFRL